MTAMKNLTAEVGRDTNTNVEGRCEMKYKIVKVSEANYKAMKELAKDEGMTVSGAQVPLDKGSEPVRVWTEGDLNP